MAVTSFKDFDLADADREWNGDAAEKRIRKWADAEDEPNQEYRDTHVWYDADNKDNFTAYKLLICDVVKGNLVAVPRAVMAAGGVIGSDVVRHPLEALHPATRAGLLELAGEANPLALRWGK